ncbi:MAG: hypothetical protein WB239_01620 [Acidimicrobiia bacterium]
MQTQNRTETRKRSTRSTRRVGYGVAVAVNVVMVVVVQNLLTWGWPAFLTPDFDRVVGIITVSLVASIIFNLAYLGYDPDWFRHGGQVVTGAISLAVTVRVYQVFPFDFSRWTFDPTGAVRVALVAAMVGVGIAVFVELLKMMRAGMEGAA